MNQSDEQMTPVQAAGYIAGITFCFIREHYRGVAIILAIAGFALMVIDASLIISPTMFRLKLGESALLGFFLLLTSAGLWISVRSKRK